MNAHTKSIKVMFLLGKNSYGVKVVKFNKPKMKKHKKRTKGLKLATTICVCHDTLVFIMHM